MATQFVIRILRTVNHYHHHPVWPSKPKQTKHSGKDRKTRKARKDQGAKITDASVEIVGNGQMSLMSEVNTNDRNQ